MHDYYMYSYTKKYMNICLETAGFVLAIINQKLPTAIITSQAVNKLLLTGKLDIY